MVYYVIADHALADVTYYPDSGKWFTKGDFRTHLRTRARAGQNSEGFAL